MKSSEIVDRIEGQEWLDGADAVLQTAADATLNRGGEAGQAVRNALHGTWLGHPLHPAITDVPVGAWSVAALLDVLSHFNDDPRIARGADAAVGIGLLGAAGAAITGLNDWQHTDPPARRVGVAHGLLNVTATTLYLVSGLMRRRGARGVGQSLGLLGYAIAGFSAFLGGHLVFENKIGVNHAPEKAELPDDFVAVLPESELRENEPQRVEAGGVKVLLLRRGDAIYALAETCSHLGGPLSEGALEGDCVRCPWHGSVFDVRTGQVTEGPAAFPQPAFETRVRDGQIEVRAAP